MTFTDDSPVIGRPITAHWGRGLSIYGSYAPTLFSPGVINYGDDEFNSEIQGTWARNGRSVCVWLFISWDGNGVKFGNAGAYTVSMPFPANVGVHTPGLITSDSTKIGDFKTRSTGGGSTVAGSVLLETATTMIFYPLDSSVPLGASDFGTDGRLLAIAEYTIDTSAL